MIGELKPTVLKARLAAVGYRQSSSAEVSPSGGDVTGRLSPYVSRQVVAKSAPFATYITRFGLTSEGDIWVTCFGVIMIHDLPTTMYFVFFFSLFFPISYCSLFEPGLTTVCCFIPKGGSMIAYCERILLLEGLAWRQGGQDLMQFWINGISEALAGQHRDRHCEYCSTKSPVIMEQDFNHRHSDQRLSTQ